MKLHRIRQVLQDIYTQLLKAYGPQGWWPARTPTEVVIGAILTQNTAWANAERAIVNLRKEGCLNWERLRVLSDERLAELLHPAGTFRVKAARLRAFVEVLWSQHGGSLDSMLDGELEEARARLLAVKGVGSETADAILLYAGNRPTFVVDAYTHRVLRRHFLVGKKAEYERVRALFHRLLPLDAKLFNEYHALLVAVGKRHCRARANCEGCPLADMPHAPLR